MAPSKCYGTTAFALVTILVIFAMFASISSCTDRARYSGGDDYLVFGAGSVHSIEGTELVIQTDNSPRYTDAGKQTRITFPSSGRIKDKLSQIKVGTRVSYSRFESVDASGSYEGNDIEIEQANTIEELSLCAVPQQIIMPPGPYPSPKSVQVPPHPAQVHPAVRPW